MGCNGQLSQVRMVRATVRWCPIFLPKMQEFDLHDIWFQQDGATCYIARITMDLLEDEFGEHFISRSEPVQLTYWKTTLKHLFVKYRLKWMQHLRRRRGQHLREIIFKTLYLWTILSIQINICFPIALKKSPDYTIMYIHSYHHRIHIFGFRRFIFCISISESPFIHITCVA